MRGNLVKVWEVYERDGLSTYMFLTKELAEAQDVFDEVDLISESMVILTDYELKALKMGRPVAGEI